MPTALSSIYPSDFINFFNFQLESNDFDDSLAGEPGLLIQKPGSESAPNRLGISKPLNLPDGSVKLQRLETCQMNRFGAPEHFREKDTVQCKLAECFLVQATAQTLRSAFCAVELLK